MNHTSRFDRDLAGLFDAREQDWRNGAVVYQVLVDRFAPSATLDAKRHLYPQPKALRGWGELPVKGRYLESHKIWSHEIDFWGGDLASTATRLDHVQQLGADVLYLNPICLAYTNHKYDALDYQQISPEYGSRKDVKALAADLHARGMKLVLDGVFNHMGRNAPIFIDARKAHEAQRPASESGHTAQGSSPYRDWFVFGPQYPGGARAWWRAENLPELNLENPAVREHIFAAHDSVVRSYLRDGVDGWRLDVAFDIGPAVLEQLTQAAHDEKPGSLVVGEIPNYPKDWFPSVDAVMHFALRNLLLRLANGQLDTRDFGRMTTRLIDDAGIENMLKSWIYLENHDTARLATLVPDECARHLVQVLQFTLPGAPNLYYGGEVDMTGGDDPEMRAAMRWDLVTPENKALAWTRRLVAMHQQHRALRVGDYRPVSTGRLFGFERHTDRVADTVLVLVNPGDQAVTETVMVANSKLMDGTRMIDLLDAQGAPELRPHAALMHVTMAPKSFRVLKPDVAPNGGYTNYKRVQ
jgi:glycosidase